MVVRGGERDGEGEGGERTRGSMDSRGNYVGQCHGGGGGLMGW